MTQLRCLAILVALVVPAAGSAQTFGQFGNVQPVPVDGHVGGGYIQTSENTLSLLGQLRLSFYPGVDVGFLGGLARQDYGDNSRTTLRLGTDLKYQVMPPATTRPLALSIGGALGVEVGDNFSILSLGPTGVLSRAISIGGESTLTPYLGAAILFSNVDVGPTSESDMSFPLRAGAELKFHPQFILVGEFDIPISDNFNDNLVFSFGVNSPF